MLSLQSVSYKKTDCVLKVNLLHLDILSECEIGQKLWGREVKGLETPTPLTNTFCLYTLPDGNTV